MLRARAQEAEDEEIAKAPVRKIKVLEENPYDLGLYRSTKASTSAGRGGQPLPDRELLPLASDQRVRVCALLEQRLRLRLSPRRRHPSGIGGAVGGTATCSCSRPFLGPGRPLGRLFFGN